MKKVIILAVVCLLFSNCPDPFMPGSFDEPQITPPAGMGYFSMRLPGDDAQQARIIKPAALQDTNIAMFELTFTPTSGTPVVVELTYANRNDNIALIAGSYTLTVTAYLDTAKTQPFLRSAGQTISVTAGGSNTIQVELLAYTMDGDGDGKFEWNLILPLSDLSAALMKITPIDSWGTAEQEINFKTGGTVNNTASPLVLKSGNYRVIISLTRDGDYQPFVHREALHIYQNMTSSFTKTFTVSDFNNWQYTVTFVYDNGTANYTPNAIHGTVISKPTDPVKTISSVPAGLYLNALPTVYEFNGWYNGSTLWNFNTEITDDITLTANWIVPGKVPETDVSNNDAASAINYAKSNAASDKEYILLIDDDVSIATQTINIANFKMTIMGKDAKRTITGDIRLENGILTVKNNCAIAGNIYVERTSNLILQGSAQIDSITLNAEASSTATITLDGAFTGSVDALNLRGESSDLDDVTSYWEDNEVIKTSASYSGGVTQADIGKFTLGYFLNNGSGLRPITGNTDGTINYEIAIEGGNGVLQEEVLGTPGLLFISIDGAAYSVSLGSCTATEIIIPRKHDGLPVTVIRLSGFSPSSPASYANWITSVKIPDSITKIENSAFSFCTSLKSITIPGSVTIIEGNAFLNCSSLTSVTISDGVTSIGGGMFKDCSSLTNITIPDSVTSIGDSAFENCSSLTSVVIPGSVTSIGNYAFKGCSNLTSITIPSSVTSIGSNTFENCTSLTSIIIPDGVTSLGSEAFRGCTSLTSVVISDSITSIGNYMFFYCSNLTSITIPGSVTSIGSNTFEYCSSLTSIIIPNSVKNIGNYGFTSCTSLTRVFYGGANAAAWDSITIGPNNNSRLTDATRYYYSATQPITANTHWRWVGDIPTIWDTAIGTGPAGGIIFYHDPDGFTVEGYGNPGDPGYFATYTAHYLEAAPENMTTQIPWSNAYVLVPNLSQTSNDNIDQAIGRGRLNTALIIAEHTADTAANNAAKACSEYSSGSKNDWFLPSYSELDKMYKAKGETGIPTTGEFWSSSQSSSYQARGVNFNGSYTITNKGVNATVRAVRAF